MKPATSTLLGMLAATVILAIHAQPAAAAEGCKELLKKALESEKAATKAASYNDSEAAELWWREYRIALSQYQACVDRAEAPMKAARAKADSAARAKAEAEAPAKAEADARAAINVVGFEVLITLGAIPPELLGGIPPELLDDDSPESTPMPSPSPAAPAGGQGHGASGGHAQ